jgi:hypothetical protein
VYYATQCSEQVRRIAAAVPWDAHLYGAMQGRNDPLLAELAQHLAEAFDLNPPKGYVRVARWGVYAVEVLQTCNLLFLNLLVE